MSINKYLLISISIAFLLASLTAPVFAASAAPPVPGTLPTEDTLGLPKSPVTEKSQILNVVAGIVQVTYWLFFAVATVMFLFAAFLYSTAAENAEKVKKAHSMLIYGAIAVAIALMAVGITAIVKSFLENPGTGGAAGGSSGAERASDLEITG